MCIHAKYLAGSLQSQLDSVSFGEAGGGPGSYLVTKQRSYLNISPKNLGLSIIFTIFFLNVELFASLVQQAGLLYFTAVL